MSFGFGFGFPRRAAAGGAAPSLNFDFTSLTSLPSRITFSRTSNATLTDSNGRVAYAPHNLLTNSEDFEASAWTKGGGATIVSNDAVAPDGTTTADRLVVPNSIGVTPRVQQNTNFTVGLLYVNSIYVKKSSYRYAFLYGGGTAMPANVAILDMDTGLFTVNQSNVASVVSVSGGWYRVAFSFTASATAADAVRIGFSDSSSTVTFNGDGVSGGLLWGAQLNVANAPVNLLTFSEQFDNAVWTKSNVTVTPNTALAPDGTTTGDFVVPTNVFLFHEVYNSFSSTSGVVYTGSFYVKAGGYQFVQLLGPGAVFAEFANFDLASGTRTAGTAGFGTIQDAGNGWYRISISAAALSSSATARWSLAIVQSGTSARAEAFTGNGTSGIFIWGAQLNTGSTALPYVATTSSIYLPPSYNSTTPKNLLGFTQEFDNAAWTKSNSFVQTNLLTWSEQFDNAAWTKSRVSVTTNTITAPDNTATADTVTEDSSPTATRSVFSSAISGVSGSSHTFSAYLKNGTRRYVALIAVDSATGLNGFRVNFDLQAGTAVQTSALGTGTYSNSSITPVGDGWYRCSVTGIVPSGTVLFGISPSTTATPSIADYGRQAYNGDGTSFFYLWGAQLVQGSVPGDYQVTTSAAAAVQYSDPNGTRTADKLVENTAASSHYILQAATAAAAPNVMSVYVKAAERSFVSLAFDGLQAWFNLSTGAVGTVEAGLTGAIQSVGGGWYRCSVARSITVAGSKSCVIYSATADNVTSYTGDGTSGIYIWGAQLSNSASVDPYVYNPQAAPTSTAYYGPRFDYNPTTLAANGLLVEEQRSNLVTYSEQFDNAIWFKADVSVTANAAVSPDGTTTADSVTPTTNSILHEIYNTFSSTSGITYTGSYYVKANGYRYVQLLGPMLVFAEYANFDLLTGTRTAGTTGFGTIESVGNGWYRISISAAALSTSATARWSLAVMPSGTSVRAAPFAGDGTSGIFAWGGQTEAGSFATSYIPTVASQVTRAADNASMLGDNFATWFNFSQGTFNATWDVGGIDTTRRRHVWIINDAGLQRLALRALDASVNNPIAAIGTGAAVISLNGVAYSANTPVKVAAAYGSNMALSQNGAAAVTDPSVASVSGPSLGIGGTVAGGTELNGHIRSISYYPTRLPNATLQSITA